jgi:hypothetical protein
MHLIRGAPSGSAVTVHLCTLLVLAGAAPSMAFAANEKEACVHAVDRAQVARLDGKLREAREGLLTCARPVCPNEIREDCTRWLAEVEASLPSVVIETVWADGHPATAVSVTLDGEPLPEAGDARAVTLDPGAHTFRFEVSGATPVEIRNVVHEGERNRLIHVTFTPTAPPAPPIAPPSPPPAPEPTLRYTPMPPAMWQPSPAETHEGSAARGPIPVPAYVLGGFALVGFGGFAYFGLEGTNRLDTLRATCVHTCSPSDVTSARSEILVGDILGFAALAATGVATVLVLTRPRVAAQH